jgi:RsiW-degrading membrane proteinase PrsW (M82 family)
VWDTKRQIIWLSTAVIFGTLVVYQNARDESEGFDPAYFALLEIILLIVIAVMFYFYSRNSKG